MKKESKKKSVQAAPLSFKELAVVAVLLCGVLGFAGYYLMQDSSGLAAYDPAASSGAGQDSSALAAAVPYYAAKYDNFAWYCGNASYGERNARCTNAEINNGDGYPAPLSCSTIGDNGGSDDGNLCSTRNKYNVYGVLSAYETANTANGLTNYFKAVSTGNRHRVIWNKPVRYYGNTTDTSPLVSQINQEFTRGVNTWFNYNTDTSSVANTSETVLEDWDLDAFTTTNNFTSTKVVKVPAHTSVTIQWNCQPWQITYFRDQSGLFGSGTDKIGHRLNFFDASVTSSLGGSTARAGRVVVAPDTDKTYSVTCRSSAETLRWTENGANYNVDVRHVYPNQNAIGMSVTVDTVPAGEVDASIAAPSQVTVGGTAAITWKADWAFSATVSGPGIATTSCAATQCNGIKTITTDPLNTVGTSTYTLSYNAYDSGGNLVTATKTAQVAVGQVPVPAPSCTLTAPSVLIPANTQTSLQYVTTNAVSASIDRSVGAITELPSGSTLFYTPGDPSTDYLYTMTVANSAGATATCSDTVFMQDDLCSNIAGYQGVWPTPAGTGSVGGGTCSCDTGYELNGLTDTDAACIEADPTPVISTLSAAPIRVHAGETTTLSWAGTDLPEECSLSSTPSVAGLDTTPASSPTEGSLSGIGPIYQTTIFTLVCGESLSAQKTVTVVPTLQEI